MIGDSVGVESVNVGDDGRAVGGDAGAHDRRREISGGAAVVRHQDRRIPAPHSQPSGRGGGHEHHPLFGRHQDLQQLGHGGDGVEVPERPGRAVDDSQVLGARRPYKLGHDAGVVVPLEAVQHHASDMVFRLGQNHPDQRRADALPGISPRVCASKIRRSASALPITLINGHTASGSRICMSCVSASRLRSGAPRESPGPAA